MANQTRNAPNLLILMVDQLSGLFFPNGPAEWLHTPNLRQLAARSVRFSRCYTASPLCAPSRASFLTGNLPSRTRVYDNAAEFAADQPTFAHVLRHHGYRTILAGKMHFTGPEQFHGYEERLTTDIYPADYGWTPDYRKPHERIQWWYHNMSSVTDSGVASISNQLEYDDEVTYQAERKLYDLARQQGHSAGDNRPWCFTVSFTHPHDPYIARPQDWELYADCPHLLPKIPALDFDQHDPQAKRILEANDWQNYRVTEEDIRRSRRAYFANISYLDRQIGRLLDVLEATGQEATILFLADHGDMLGERGLWFKMHVYDGAALVPLMIASPKLSPSLVTTPVSTTDISTSLAALAGLTDHELLSWQEAGFGQDSTNLLPLALNPSLSRPSPVAMEYAAEASISPIVSLVTDRWKFIRSDSDPDMLFDHQHDADELHNLALPQDQAHTKAHAKAHTKAKPILTNEVNQALMALRNAAQAKWDLAQFDREVRASQQRRLMVYGALRQGHYQAWDYQPLAEGVNRYMRNHLDLNHLEINQRYPRGNQPKP